MINDLVERSYAVRRIRAYFDACPDNLSTEDLKHYFASLIALNSWSTVKLDRNGLHSLVNRSIDMSLPTMAVA
ncbi:phage integrase N-terminal SAM-like domain-containing protein [Shewanella sp. 10N.286.52.A9]|uniref:phage integrase N-terminal SAM-like domain-containing protein n=1 Tax=Shewanella sp. 10N.286.52.A9 TaxID=3229711 RepID=UPI00354C4BDD